MTDIPCLVLNRVSAKKYQTGVSRGRESTYKNVNETDEE